MKTSDYDTPHRLIKYALLPSLLIVLIVSGCSLRNQDEGNSKAPVSVPTIDSSIVAYPDGNRIPVDSPDREKFIRNLLGREYILQPSSTEFYWTKITASDVLSELNEYLTGEDWQLKTNWGHRDALILSSWEKGNLELSILLFDDLDSVGIESLSKNYGISGPVPGSSMLVLHLMNKVTPSP